MRTAAYSRGSVIIVVLLSTLLITGLVVGVYLFFRQTKIEINLSSNPPKVAIIKWPSVHQLSIKEIKPAEVIININGEDYVFSKNSVEDFQRKVTIQHGIEAGMTYELVESSNNAVTLKASYWEVSPSWLHSFSNNVRPSVSYQNQKYTDYQLLVLSKEASNYNEAYQRCLQTKDEPKHDYLFTFRHSCMKDLSLRAVREDKYTEAVKICKKDIEQAYTDFCLNDVLAWYIWNNSLNNVSEKKRTGQLCDFISDQGEKSRCDRDYSFKLESEMCQNDICLMEIAQKVEMIDEEGAETVCRQITNADLVTLCLENLRKPR